MLFNNQGDKGFPYLTPRSIRRRRTLDLADWQVCSDTMHSWHIVLVVLYPVKNFEWKFNLPMLMTLCQLMIMMMMMIGILISEDLEIVSMSFLFCMGVHCPLYKLTIQKYHVIILNSFT